MKKILLTLSLLLIVNTFFTQLTFAKGSFKDIGASYWAKEEIEFLSNQAIISGDGGGRFHPNDYITREQAALMLGRLFNLKNQGASYAIADLTAFDVLGKSASDDRKGNMTRGEMAKAIAVAYGLQSTKVHPFKDVSKNSYYAKYINALAQNNITKGFSDETYRPDEPVTRAQFSVFVTKAIKQGVHVDFNNKIRGDITKEDVIRLLGQPNEKYDLVDTGSERLWIYTNTIDKSKFPPVLQELNLANYMQVAFKENNLLSSVTVFVKPTGNFKELSDKISFSLNFAPTDKLRSEYNGEKHLWDTWNVNSRVNYSLINSSFVRSILITKEVHGGSNLKMEGQQVGWESYWPEGGFSLIFR